MGKIFDFRCLVLMTFLMLLFHKSSLAKGKEIVINPSIPLNEQLIYPKTKYVIQNDIDLEGVTVTLPYLAELEIRKGVLSNGIIEGNSSYISLKKNCLENVYIRDGVCSISKKVKTSCYKGEFCGLLNSICNICPNNGVVIMDKKNDYVIDTPIVVRRSISIIGRNSAHP